MNYADNRHKLESLTLSLEDRLQASLKPLEPDTRFVSGLKERLDRHPMPVSRLSQMPYIALSAIGVFAGIVMVVTGLRALITLLTKRGYLVQIKQSSA